MCLCSVASVQFKRLYLSGSVRGRNDYINAVSVQVRMLLTDGDWHPLNIINY